MRPVLYCVEIPKSRSVAIMCGLVGEEHVTEEKLAKLAPLELALLYDYAIRVHLNASDNPVRVRPRPSLLDRL